MKLTKEKKIFTAILIFYWLCLLIATHIPVPMWVRKMGVSDKTMHFAAYMVLTILLWLASSFDLKANWRKLRPWLIWTIALLYAVVDEIMQHFIVGRSMDLLDMISDMLGVAAGMLTVTFISGYHSAMILVIVSPIFLPAIVRSRLIKESSILEGLIYLAGFVSITAAWAIYLTLISKLDLRKIKTIPLFFICPAVSVVIVKFYAMFTNKPFEIENIFIAFVSIIATLLICRILFDVYFVKRVANQNKLP